MRKRSKSKSVVVAFRKDRRTGKTKPITKSLGQLKRTKIVKTDRRFPGIKPKKWAQQSGIKKGELKKYGYDPNASQEARRKALVACVNAEGYQVCRSRVQWLVNVAKDDTRLDRIYKQDLAFVEGMKTERTKRWRDTLTKIAGYKPKKGQRFWRYASKSTPGKSYYVTKGKKGGLSCSCPGFILGARRRVAQGLARGCSHTDDVKAGGKGSAERGTR